jgi:hypothetical protein
VGKAVYEQEPALINISGYDYLGLDFYGSDTNTFKELSSFYARFLLGALELKKRYKLKGIVFKELGYPHHGIEAYWNDQSLSADEIMTKIYDIVFKLGAGRMDGFFPWVWYDGVYTLVPSRTEYIAPSRSIGFYYSNAIEPYQSLEKIAARVESCPPLTCRAAETLFSDGFGNDSLWSLSDGARVRSGVLEIKGEGHAYPKEGKAAEWKNYVLSGKFKPIDGEFGIQIRENNISQTMYCVVLKPIAEFHVLKWKKDKFDFIRGLFPLVEFNKWHTFSFYAIGQALHFFIDGEKVTDYWDKKPFLKGGISLHAQGHVLFDDISVRELEEQPRRGPDLRYGLYRPGQRNGHNNGNRRQDSLR